MVSTKEATRSYSEAGEKKANLSICKMIVLGMVAGFFIAFAGVGATAGAVSVQGSLSKIINACIFPAGLAMVVLNGSELFTGNNLMIISVLDKKITFYKMIKNWFYIYIGNMLGSLIFTFLCAYGHVYSAFDNKLAISLLNTASYKCSLSFTDAIIKGILCNVLVCVAVFMTYMTKTAACKIICLFFPIMVFVISGFEHSVANMSYISGGLFINQLYGDLGQDVTNLTWWNFIIHNLLPVSIGNAVGGTVMGIVYWYSNLCSSENRNVEIG